MAKFVLSYQGGAMAETEAEQKAVMDEWMAWFGSLGAAVVDAGAPFAASKTVASDGAVSDGNAAALTGYSIIDAAGLDDATEKAKGCPVLAGGGSVGVHEVHEM